MTQKLLALSLRSRRAGADQRTLEKIQNIRNVSDRFIQTVGKMLPRNGKPYTDVLILSSYQVFFIESHSNPALSPIKASMHEFSRASASLYYCLNRQSRNVPVREVKRFVQHLSVGQTLSRSGRSRLLSYYRKGSNIQVKVPAT